MFLTVFGFIARGVLDLRVWPPHFSNRVHSRLRCSGVISVMFIASSSGARYAAISRYRSTVFGARFSSACCFMNSARSIARVVGIGAATPAVPAFALEFLLLLVRRTTSASVASCLVAKPNSRIGRFDSRVDPGGWNL